MKSESKRAVHPGRHLADELRALGMSATRLARQIEVPPNRITAILNGQRSITGDTALRLGHYFQTSPEFWLNLQNVYQLDVARRAAGAEIAELPRLEIPD